MSSLRAGAANRVVTPPLGAPLAGYFEPHYAQEIVNDLMARALVLDDGSHRVALVGVDVIALSAGTVARVRAEAERRAGIGPGHTLLWATHTHTGPQTVDLFLDTVDAAYLAFLEDRIVEAIEAAASALVPARLAYATGAETSLNCNRRLVFRDGTVHTHITDADLPEVAGREGPSDPEVGVLGVSDEHHAPLAVLVNYALHPTNVRGDRICTDYPGYLAEYLSAALGKEVVTVFANGACGNLDSKTPYLDEVPYGPGRAQRIGADLSDAVLAALDEPSPVDPATLHVLSATAALPLKEVPPAYLEKADDVLDGATPPDELYFTKGTRRPSALKERVYAHEARRMAEWRAASPHVQAEVQAIRIGNLAIVAVPVELFTEYGLEIKRYARKRFAHAMVVELANGYFGYVPTRKSFEGGGYETRLSRSSPLAPDTGDILVATAKSLLDAL